MKKTIAAVLIMAMLSLVPARVGFGKTIYEADYTSLSCVEAIGSLLYYYDPVTEELRVYDPATEQTESYSWQMREWVDQGVQYVRYPSTFVAKDDILYAIMVHVAYEFFFDCAAGSVLSAELCALRLTESGVEETVVEQLDWDLMIESDDLQGEISREIYRAVWLEDGLYLHVHTNSENPDMPWGWDSLLVRFRVPGGRAEEIDLKVVMEMAAWGGNALLIVKIKEGGRRDLCVYRPGEEPETLMEDFEGRAIACDGETKTLYYTDRGRVFALVEGKDPEQRAILPFAGPSGARYLEGAYYAAIDYDIAVVKIGEAIQPRTLTIAGTAGIPEDIGSGFMSENENVQLVERNFSAGDLVQLLLTQSDAVDLLAVNTGGSEIGKLILDRGYVEAIESAAVAQAVGRIYPQLLEFASRDGKLYALPYEMIVQQMEAVNMALFYELGYADEDLPDTWQEFLDFCKAWEDARMGEEGVPLIAGLEPARARKTLFGMLVYEYSRLAERTGRPLDYDEPLFRGWMETLMSINFYELGLDPDGGDALFDLAHSLSPENIGWGPVAHPLEAEAGAGTAAPISMSILMVNPYAREKELALAFLDYVAQNLDPVTRAGMMPGENDPVRPEDYEAERALRLRALDALEEKLLSADEQQAGGLLQEKKQLLDSMEFSDRTSWRISEESLLAYRAAVSEMLVPQEYGLNTAWSEVEEARDQYFGGAIDLDGLIHALNRVIRMRALEGD